MMLTGPNMSLFYDILSNPFRYIMVLLSREDIIHRCRTSDPFILHYFLFLQWYIELDLFPSKILNDLNSTLEAQKLTPTYKKNWVCLYLPLTLKEVHKKYIFSWAFIRLLLMPAQKEDVCAAKTKRRVFPWKKIPWYFLGWTKAQTEQKNHHTQFRSWEVHMT